MKNGPYELVVAPENYPGKKYRGRYIYLHHLMMWRKTGKILCEGEVVHHKNGDKRDNRISNLELTTNSEHAREHGLKRGRTLVVLICSWCGSAFKREKRIVHKHHKNYYCNRSCMGYHQAKIRYSRVP